MRLFTHNRLGLKILVPVLLVKVLAVVALMWFIIAVRTSELESMMFAKARTDALLGARIAQHILQDMLIQGRFSHDQLFNADYRPIAQGPLAGADPPKYRTAYDQYLDRVLQRFEDVFLDDRTVVFAVLVDRNGYLPTHNSRFARPLTGDAGKDLINNRTKRIFDDPVGLAAARYTGGDGQGVLRQVYHRDTGVTMWDISAPVEVNGEHWGSFRIGMSMAAVMAARHSLIRSVSLAGLLLVAILSLTLLYFIQRASQPLLALNRAVEGFSAGGTLELPGAPDDDEIGRLINAFNRMVTRLKQTSVSRDYLNRVLESMHDSLLVLNPAGEIQTCNPATWHMLGYDEAELIGMHISELLVDVDGELDWFDRLISARDGQRLELDYRTRDGGRLPVAFSCAPLMTGDGEVQGMICIAQDNTERTATLEKLDTSRRFLESVIDCLPEELMVLNPDDLQVLKVNSSFRQAYGLGDDQILGRTCYELTHQRHSPCEAPDHYCPVQEVLELGQGACCEHRHVDAAGKETFQDIQISTVSDAVGRPLFLLHLTRDITQRKRAQQEIIKFAEELERNNAELEEKTRLLEQAHSELKESQSRILQQEKMASIGQLSAGIAHEINNPIGFVSSNLATLGRYAERLTGFIADQEELLEQQGAFGDEIARLKSRYRLDRICRDIHELIAESREGTDRVRQIVLDLKGFSRVDDADCKEVNLHECLDSTLNIAWNEIKYKAKVRKEYGDLPPVRCYPQQLNQVFMNLLVNAANAIDQDGEIVIRTWLEADQVHVAISDTGCGIPEEIQRRVFEPFFTTKEVGKGTGLGLSISYDIIKKHQGEIRLQSQVGSGTTFTVSLPRAMREAS